MTFAAKGPPRGESTDGPEVVFLEEKASNVGPKTAPAQAEILLEAVKALSAEEICADTLENITLVLAASGWRSTATLLTHAAGCADAGDFLSAERNRQRAGLQFIEANDAFRQFQESREKSAAVIGAEAFR